jgi:AraC family transcriptional regulator of adaptative response / DNA-3-methyladenine glycosylase II
MIPDFETCYGAVTSKDARFDGWFVTAVTSTQIYCRPSCPAITPKRANVIFLPTAAAAQAAGFRACKRCRPDASPGSPEWNVRADLVGRAMMLIADGLVEREGVAGLAKHLGYSERHLNRQLIAEVGAGPQALARAQRAQTARILIETTDLAFTSVAFAAGFASIRQFNDTIKQVFANSPTHLRSRKKKTDLVAPGSVTLRLPYRKPFHPGVIEFLGIRAIDGIETFDSGRYSRSLSLPSSSATVSLQDTGEHIRCVLRAEDLRDLSAAVHRCRMLLDLDSDPVSVDSWLAADPKLAPYIKARPGIRLPGAADPFEIAVRAILGQQVSVAAARTLAGRIVALYGKPLTAPDEGLTHAFPSPAVIAESELAEIGMPAKRRFALRNLAAEIAEGNIVLDAGIERAEAFEKLVALPGIGPWTASYISMRALGDPDAFLPTDLGVRHGLAKAGYPTDVKAATAVAEKWRPWRSYAVHHLWSASAGHEAKAVRLGGTRGKAGRPRQR